MKYVYQIIRIPERHHIKDVLPEIELTEEEYQILLDQFPTDAVLEEDENQVLEKLEGIHGTITLR